MASDPLLHPAVQREVERARVRNAHPLMPHGAPGQRRGDYGVVQAVEQVHGVYLPDALFRWYWIQRKTCQEIADDLGVTQGCISRWLSMLGLNQKSILARAARQLQEDPGWALEGKDAWQPPSR